MVLASQRWVKPQRLSDGKIAGPVVDHSSCSHPARCRDPAAREQAIDVTRKEH